MTAPLLPVHLPAEARPISYATIAKCMGILVVIWVAMGWVQFPGRSNPLGTSPKSVNSDTDALALGGSIKEATSPPTEEPTKPSGPVLDAAPAAGGLHIDRVAVIIEDRPLGNLIPVILHFHSVLGPEWPMVLYTTPSTSSFLQRSAPFSRLTTSSSPSTSTSKPAISIRHLPANVSFSTHASVSTFLTSPFLWTDLAPYTKVLLFQADSILCSGSPLRVDDFLDFDLVGAPIDAAFGTGFNGGLSLRNRELMLRVIERWSFKADSTAPDAPQEWRFEDQWFFARMSELGEYGNGEGEGGRRGEEGVEVSVSIPDRDTAARFAVETVWVGGKMPLGFHQPQRWQGEHMEEIMEYCPEVGMIAGSSFFG